MSSYLITGASRGIGFGFLEHLSATPTNTVIGLVRDTATTETKIRAWNRSNVHLVAGDLSDYDSLKRAVDATSNITGGKLDYLIANAALLAGEMRPLSVLGTNPTSLTTHLTHPFSINVVGNIHLINLFLPLILQGHAKKVIAISSGFGDIDLVRNYSLALNASYAINKAALNMAVAQFSAEFGERRGVLFLSVSPGFVETGQYDCLSEEENKAVLALAGKFSQYSPDFKGPISPEESVKAVLKVVEESSVEKGDGGAFYSHLGKGQKWL